MGSYPRNFMPIACGIDIENKDRVKRLLTSGAFPIYLFGRHELENIQQNDETSLCKLFTLKEAILKSLGFGWFNGPISWADIALRTVDNKDIEIGLSDKIKEIFIKEEYRRIDVTHIEIDNNSIAEVLITDKGSGEIIRERAIIDIDGFEKKFSGINSAAFLDMPEEFLKMSNIRWCRGRVVEFLAGRVAAAQCVLNIVKKFNKTTGIRFSDIKIANDSCGRPVIENTEELKLPVVPVLSISHNKKYAVSVVAAYLN